MNENNPLHYFIREGPPVVVTDHAACKGRPEFLMPDSQGRSRQALADTNIAKAICLNDCPVLDQCRTWSLTVPDPVPSHIAAGMTPQDRKQVRTDDAPVRPTCGTTRGVNTHRRNHEAMCDRCKAWHAMYTRKWAQAKRRQG